MEQVQQVTEYLSERGFFDGRPLEAQGSYLSRLLLQLLLILATPRVLHYLLLQHLWQPRVVSEIISGIILGPSLMGQIPGWTSLIFPEFSIATLATIASLGLVMFLYMVGLGINSQIIESEWTFVFGCVAMSASFAMLFAPPLTFLFWVPEGESIYTRGTYVETMLWVAIMLGITATGVLARILAERGILAKRLGGVVMATTAVNLMYHAWLLAIALSMFGVSYTWIPPDPPIPGKGSPLDAGSRWDPIYITVLFIGFVLFLRFPGRWVWTKLAIKAERKKKLDQFIVWFALLWLFACAYIMQTATLAGRLGGLCFSLFAIPRIGTFPMDLRKHVEGLVMLLFMPMFYAWSGLRTDLFHLTAYDLGLAIAMMICSYIIKFSSIYMISCAHKMHGFKGAYFGVLHATKGFASMVMCNAAFDVGLITRRFFTICILFSIITTILVTPILRLIQLFETWFKARWGKKPVPPKVYRILTLPLDQTSVNPIIQLAELLYSPRLPNVSVTTTRCVTSAEMDDSFTAMYLEAASSNELGQDPILSAAKMVWHPQNPTPLELRAVTIPESNDLIRYVYGQGTTGNSLEESDDPNGGTFKAFQAVILDFDSTPLRSSLIDTLIMDRKVDLYVVTAPETFDFSTIRRILLLLGSTEVERDNELATFSLALHFLRNCDDSVLTVWKHLPSEENPLPPFGQGHLADVPEPEYINFEGDLANVLSGLSQSVTPEYDIIIAPNFTDQHHSQSIPQAFLTSTGLSNITDMIVGESSDHPFAALQHSTIPLIIVSSIDSVIAGVNPYSTLVEL